MDFSTLKAMSIPQSEVVKIEVNGVVVWEMPSSYKNWVPYSINADGTIYNNGLGYKEKYRLRSGGAEGAADRVVITGFIPLKIGDTLRISPAFNGGNTWNTLNFYDSSFTHLGQVTDSGSYYGICNSSYKTSVINGVSTLTLTSTHNSTIAWVRIGHDLERLLTGANVIVTVNEEIS